MLGIYGHEGAACRLIFGFLQRKADIYIYTYIGIGLASVKGRLGGEFRRYIV
jgi:hypothetical protein